MSDLTVAELQAARLRAQEFAYTHVAQGARELLNWHQTARLEDGAVRELADMLDWAPGDQRLKLAEGFFERAALRYAAGVGATA